MINVALAQTRITSTQDNLRRILCYLDQAIQRHSDIIVFPEFALQYYTLPVKQPTYEMLLPYFEKICSKCKKGKIYAIMPTVIKEGKKRFNRSFLINRSGEIQYVYTKQFLFWKEKEIAKVSPGYKNRVIETDFGKIGILQCYDIYSTQRLKLAKPLVEKGAKVIFVPSDSVHYDFPGRENEKDIEKAPLIIAKKLGVFVAVCDTFRPKPENADPGDLDNEYSYCFSRVVNQNGKVVSSIRNKEGIIFADIEI